MLMQHLKAWLAPVSWLVLQCSSHFLHLVYFSFHLWQNFLLLLQHPHYS